MKKLFLVAAKLIGLLQLYWAFGTLLNIGAALAAREPGDGDRMVWPFLIGTVLYGFLSFAVAYLLIAKTDTLARVVGLADDDPLPQVPPPDKLLRTGILLLGIYFLFTPIPNAVKTLADIFNYSENARNPAWVARSLTAVCQFGLALYLLREPDNVIRLLTRKKQDRHT